MSESELRADVALVRAALDNGVLIRGEIAYSVSAVIEWAERTLTQVRSVSSGNKYHRRIYGLKAYHPEPAFVTVDLYAVFRAYALTCSASQHAAKKIICAGLRSKGSKVQDLREARDALDRAIEDAEREEEEAKGAAA